MGDAPYFQAHPQQLKRVMALLDLQKGMDRRDLKLEMKVSPSPLQQAP